MIEILIECVRMRVAGGAPVWSVLAVGAPVSRSMGCNLIGGDGFGVVVHGVARVDLRVHQKPPS